MDNRKRQETTHVGHAKVEVVLLSCSNVLTDQMIIFAFHTDVSIPPLLAFNSLTRRNST
jgi:hypothetical protein